MCITGLVNVCNIAGNAVLINGLGPFPQLGAAGAALSSSIFRAVGLLLMAWAFFRAEPGVRLSRQDVWPDARPSAAPASAHRPARRQRKPVLQSVPGQLPGVREPDGHLCGHHPHVAAMFANCIYMLVMAISQAGQVLVGYWAPRTWTAHTGAPCGF